MRKRISAMLLAVAMVVTTFLSPLTVEAAQDKVNDYKVITPADYDAAKKYPVVYVMPEDGYKMDNSGMVEKLQSAMENGVTTDMIIVTPEFAADTDLYTAMENLVAEVDAQYSTLAGNEYRAVVGTGVGGYLAYILGITKDNQAVTAPELFKYVAGIRSDFVSEANPWYGTYGDVYTYYTSMTKEALQSFFMYLDTPVDDAWADMEGSTNDLGNVGIGNALQTTQFEYTARLGSFTDAFFTESVNRVADRLANGMMSGIVSGSVSLTKAHLTSAEKEMEVTYTANVTDVINSFSANEEAMKVTVAVVDPATGEVLTSYAADANVTAGAVVTETVKLENLINGSSSDVVLSVELLGKEFTLAETTVTRIKDTTVENDYLYADLMGDWYFNYVGSNPLDATTLTAEEYKTWSVVTPALDWWKKGFGNINETTVSCPAGWEAYFDYLITGDGYYVREFEVTEEFVNADKLILSVGNLDDRGQAFINGQLVGETGMVNGESSGESAWESYSAYEFDPSILNANGTNTIVVRCHNDGMGGGGWYSGPVAIYSEKAFAQDTTINSLFEEETFESHYAAEGLKDVGEEVTTDTVENEYMIYLPESYYTSDKYYPTVYLMHQYNSTHTSYRVDDIDYLVDEAIKQALIDEMIVIVPNSHEESWWKDNWMKMISEELVPLIDSKYRTIDDARYRFTAGCSMGGQGAYGVALQNPELFSGAISFFGAFSMGGEASPNYIAERESAEYLSYYTMYFICGNQDIYQFGQPAIDLHQQLLAKNVEHEFFIENGGHDSPFYLPYFIDAMVYTRDNMYHSDTEAGQYLGADVVIDTGLENVQVTFNAAEGIKEYYNYIPDSSYTEDNTPALSVPLTIEIVQDGEVVFSVTERDNYIEDDQLSAVHTYDLPAEFDAEAYYEVHVKAAVFDNVYEVEPAVEVQHTVVEEPDANVPDDDEETDTNEGETPDANEGEEPEEGTSTKPVKTGDETPVMLYVVTLVMAAAVAVIVLKRRRA